MPSEGGQPVRVLGVIRLALCAAATAVLAPSAAFGAPAPPAVVEPVSIGDPYALQRAGLALRPGPAPRLQASPLLKGLGGGRMIDPQGRLVLLGKYGWIYRGPDQRHLRVVGWRAAFHGEPQTLGTADGGFLFLYEGFTVAAEPDLTRRWSTAVSSEPVALGPGGLLYALGGTPAVLDLGTGRIIAWLEGLQRDNASAPVVAPDGTLRSIRSNSDRSLSLLAHGPDGRLLWAVPLGDGATEPTIGPDGTSYIGVFSGAQGGLTTTGEVVAVGPDGVVRWRSPTTRQASRPAIDARGVVWSGAGGSVFALDDRGQRIYERLIGAPSISPSLIALGDGVLVQDGSSSSVIRLAARPAAKLRPAPALRVVPAAFGLRERPFTCVAPPEGRPRTCLYSLTAGGEARVVAPTDGTIRLSVRRASDGAMLFRQGSFRVFAGENRIRINGTGTEPACDLPGCLLTPGRYLLQARIPIGGGRARVLTSAFRILASAGRPFG
jgi:hypothetical protein